MTSAALPDPTNIRVAVTNPTTGFRSVQDAVVGTTQVINFPVPATTGYVVEAISYKPGRYDNLMLKYGKKVDISVESGKIAEVNLTLQRPNVSVTIPSSVTTGSKFQIQIANVPEYFRSGNMRAIVSNQPTSSASLGEQFYSRDGKIDLNAPNEVGSGRMYVQVYESLTPTGFASTVAMSYSALIPMT